MAIISYKRIHMRIHCFLKKLRLRPIKIYLFHQVSDVFDNRTMKKGDWTESQLFKNNISTINSECHFISLVEATDRIRRDVFRFRKYAVLTSDDGWESLKNILPWLNEQAIPVTLFVNPSYLDGIHFREKNTERYLHLEDLVEICAEYPLVSIGLHGWEHIRVSELNEDDFRNSIDKSLEVIREIPSFVPYYCYPYGDHNIMNDRVLKDYGLIPVLVDNGTNVDDSTIVHRILLDGKRL